MRRMNVIIELAIMIALCSPLSRPLRAGELDAAIRTGEFAAFLADADARLSEKLPESPSGASLTALLQDSAHWTLLDQRQLIAKSGGDKLGAFARADPANREFLSWLMRNTRAMDLYLEGSVPIGLAAREANQYTLDTTALEIWRKILQADPDAKEGLLLKLAIATAILPPGSINIGAGRADKAADPVMRYQYFKTAHQKKELFPSFDRLSVWEYTHIVSSGASDEDLTWARAMINTFRPDLRANELVVNSTSLVWRRNAPEPFWRQGVGFGGTFRNVLAGGGKCGPRSSWSVMVCQAFGIPAIGVGQPAHACVAYKAANPMTEPQPGSAWKVGYGAGWEKSTLIGLKGPDFLAGVAKRADAEKFSQVEHLRWLADSVSARDKAAAIMEVAHQINESIAAVKTDLTASLKPEEAESDPGVKAGEPAKANRDGAIASPGAVVTATGGVIHVDAASFAKTGGTISWGGQTPHVLVHESFGGGRQVYFQQQMKEQWADYTVDVPVAGTWRIVMKVACINDGQLLEVCAGGKTIATVPMDLSWGLWEETKPVELQLEKGIQTLRIQTPVSVNAENHKRGIALRSFELRER